MFAEPMSIATPDGCERWEEMYPHYALFVDERREQDAGRLWFWNSMRFPLPMPAFDVASIDGPYYALGAWQNRAFAVSPAMEIDYRVVNSYIYISVNPVTDPEKIAERAEHFQKRAGYYFGNWDDLYGKWQTKMETLLAQLAAVDVPKLPEYEPDEVVFGDEDTTFYKVLDACLSSTPTPSRSKRSSASRARSSPALACSPPTTCPPSRVRTARSVSRGAMLTAAIAKASGARPTVVGKPSKAAVLELQERLGVPATDLLVTGDDVRMDVGLGLLGGSRTVLVRSGISGALDVSTLPERQRPHAVVDGVGELLAWL